MTKEIERKEVVLKSALVPSGRAQGGALKHGATGVSATADASPSKRRKVQLQLAADTSDRGKLQVQFSLGADGLVQVPIISPPLTPLGLAQVPIISPPHTPLAMLQGLDYHTPSRSLTVSTPYAPLLSGGMLSGGFWASPAAGDADELGALPSPQTPGLLVKGEHYVDMQQQFAFPPPLSPCSEPIATAPVLPVPWPEGLSPLPYSRPHGGLDFDVELFGAVGAVAGGRSSTSTTRSGTISPSVTASSTARAANNMCNSSSSLVGSLGSNCDRARKNNGGGGRSWWEQQSETALLASLDRCDGQADDDVGLYLLADSLRLQPLPF